MDELPVALPGWLDWGWALRVLDGEVRLPGERVQPADGVVAVLCRLGDRSVDVTVRATAHQLAVAPPVPAARAHVVRRFHLDLDEGAVSAALDRSGLVRFPGKRGWVRRPAAAELWGYCLTFLCGGDPDAAPVQRMFAELGTGGPALGAPEPDDLLTFGEGELVAFGIARHRARNVLGLARAFALDPGRYDEATLRSLPADEAVARLATLPHIGRTRARTIARVALGHEDVLADLARHDDGLQAALGVSWAQVRRAASDATPYRSVLSDSLIDALE